MPENKENKRIRILYINQPAGGGALNALYEMLRKINLNLIEPFVICYYENSYTKKLETIENCNVFYLTKNNEDTRIIKKTKNHPKLINVLLSEFNILAKYFIRDRKETNEIYDLIKQIRPDIIHHNSGLPADRSSIRAASKAGIPQVLHIRGIWKYPKKSIHFLLHYFLQKKITAWIFYTEKERDYYKRIFHLRADTLFVLNDFVNQSVFKATPPNEQLKRNFGIQDKDFVITNPGRITKWKGQHVLIEAIHLIKDFPRSIKILIVGPSEEGLGSEDYLQELKNSVKSYQLENQVVFTGNREDAADIINLSDIIIHTSVKPEPQGLVIIEALLCHKKVIATNAGGAAELVKKYGGYLAEPGDANALAKKIKEIIINKNAETEYPLRYKKLKDDFNPEIQIKQLMEIYRVSLVKKGKI